MRPARAVFVDTRTVLECGHDAHRATGFHAVHEVVAHQAARIPQAVRMEARFGVQQDPAGFDGASSQHYRPAFQFVVLFCDGIEERNAFREPVVVHQHLVTNRIRSQRKIRELLQLRDNHVQAAEPCAHIATPPAFTAVVTGWPAIISGAKHRRALEQNWNADFFCALLEKKLRAAGLVGRAAIYSIWHVEVVFWAWPRDANQPFHFVVVRNQIVIAQRPVVSEALHRFRLEIELPVTETGPAPSVGSASHAA